MTETVEQHVQVPQPERIGSVRLLGGGLTREVGAAGGLGDGGGGQEERRQDDQASEQPAGSHDRTSR